VTGQFEAYCGRRLAARTYRNPVTLAGLSHTVNSPTVTGAGFNAMKRLDDLAGANLQLGTRLKKITSDTSLDLTKPAKTTGSASITFGSKPITIDGSGLQELRIPQSPLHAVYSANYLDQSGNKTALDLTAARIQEQAGPGYARVLLMNDVVPKGSRNVEVECFAGYRTPTGDASDMGDWEAWAELELLCWRMLQVNFQDYAQAAGRTGDLSLVEAAQHVGSFELPKDIRQGLAPFRRLG